ncbi:MAG TPA: TFIIB-type zinc finger domain-containing protein, partial [Pyrinomonadaceae bacterium]|nr:TFIIB-type zinc finger domain-containing protein [Pyrinomonadaceae bacterium]
MKSVAASPERVHQFPCPSCGADLRYEPHDGFLTCGHCGHKEAIPESAATVQERPFEQYAGRHSEQAAGLAVSALEVQCQGCGAK